MSNAAIAIVSEHDDLHALTVCAAIRKRGYRCHIIEANNLANKESIAVYFDNSISHAVLRSSDNSLVDLSNLSAIWWRRYRGEQLLENNALGSHERSLIHNDCKGGLIGALEGRFFGQWLSHPLHTERASNKLYQLSIARRHVRIPKTIVTQSPSVVRDFFNENNGKIIVKPVAGTPGPLLFTKMVSDDMMNDVDRITACPAIYQEYIPGETHIRLNIFGDKSYAAKIKSSEIDWRPDVSVPITPWSVPDELHRTMKAILNDLNLKMGIFDLKLLEDGEVVWLEVNPQGQFLFLEGISKIRLTDYFSEFLISQAEQG